MTADDAWPLDITPQRSEARPTLTTAEPITVVHYGLGPIGIAVGQLVGTRAGLTSVGAVDIDPDLCGRTLGDVLGGDSAGTVITSALDAFEALDQAAVAVHSTGSSLVDVAPQVLECVEAGLNVVSTCEELSYPWFRAPDLAHRIDEAARRHEVTVLGTGVNPGFAMDYLPVVLSGAAQTVNGVRVLRVQDAGRRRVSLQRKIGAGLDVAAFRDKCRSGEIRHVGLSESLHAIAGALGWTLADERETIEPIIADVPTHSGLGEIAPGRVAGIRQAVIGTVSGHDVLSLVMEMAVGLGESRDEIILDGDPDLRMVIPSAAHGDHATAAVVVNSIERVMRADAGLVTMTDIPTPHP